MGYANLFGIYSRLPISKIAAIAIFDFPKWQYTRGNAMQYYERLRFSSEMTIYCH
jgi:hypothetical protein